ncbi:transglycosylase domain-containing protein [Halobacillus sp. A5]|uniref:transglycosylase domain-containing protein n=1 Tax=Halobacillus sp. A5 TaxID=2880263 RepID=UPI0020A669F6|nr:transglycosylase domain-containing protein [Halobacillus sp. A5]MCP3025360.1 penicillin-binding protein [Halobacillus sp. A5]
MSNNPKNERNKVDWKSLWQSGKIQKNSRIGYEVAWNVILFFIIVGIIGLFFAGGVGAGYFASLVKDEPTRSQADMEEDIYNYEETSEVYFAGEELLGDVQTDLYREEVSLDDVNNNLSNAVISTEDEYFNTHDGVVPKAVMRALVQEATNSSVKTGGSTLTQQIVKNQILTNEVSFERKAKEILIAMRVEKFFEKDDILEAYLNIVPFGRNSNGDNIAGAKTAAEGIFGVSTDELSIPQAAFIAGLPQNPYSYTPFENNGDIKSEEALQPGLDRMEDVLSNMHDADYISDEEYEEALEFDLVGSLAEPTTKSREKYPYLTDEVQRRAKDIMVEQLAEENGDSMEDIEEDEELKDEYETLAERQLSSGGYKIHTTIDKEVYDVMQEVKDNYNNYGSNRTVELQNEDGELVETEIPVQVASTLIENSSRKILGFIGGRDYEQKVYNYATQAKRLPGSTMKPLAAYGPGIDMGEVQPGSVIADVPYNYPSEFGGGKPDNYGGGFSGFTSAREALKNSYNIPAIKAYMEIIDENPGENYLDKMGFTTFNEEHYSYPSLALGTVDVKNEDITNAYATFGNGGNHVDAYMIEKIETKEGETFYEHEQSEGEEVFSPQANYLTIDMMRDVLDSGTASSVPGQLTNSGVDWAGKTGTSQDYKDAWFIATNPNVTMSSWMGYDFQEQLNSNGYSQRNTGLWAEVVNAVSEVRPDLMVPEGDFEKPDGIVDRSYCATSGLLASDLCESAGLSKNDMYISEFAPSEEDDSLMNGDFVDIKGDIYPAGDNTPGEFIIDEGDGVIIKPDFLEENDYDSSDVLEHLLPDSGSWDNVALPSGEGSGASSDEVENDGEAPAAPGSVSADSSSISWSDSSSDDVVGYRVYRASSPDGSFSRIGSTRGTNYDFSGDDGVYAVRAVDYFGESSSLSSTTEVGNPGESNEEESDDNSNENDSSEDNSSEDSESDNNGQSEESSNSEDDNESEENESEEESQDEDNEGSEGASENDDSGDSDESNEDNTDEDESEEEEPSEDDDSSEEE